MWQVLLAAAVATGSGVLAKRFLNHNHRHHHSDSSTEDGVIEDFHYKDNPFLQSQSRNGDYESFVPGTMNNSSTIGDGDAPIFKFSSSGSSNNPRKKGGSGYGGKRGSISGMRKVRVLDQSKGGKRKLTFCLKKRRTSRNGPGKCESCSSKDNSMLSWGVGMSIMFMMSTGKAEICRLNEALGETAKTVQDLKSEILKRKSSCYLQYPNKSDDEVNMGKIQVESTQQLPHSKKYSVRDPIIVGGSEEGECASSVLTEEPQLEMMDMDQLEAEFESELLKLPWGLTDQGMVSEICESNASVGGNYQQDRENIISYQHSGVVPSELDQKLCHLLIEQQESQIVELESELHQAQSKISAKEAELQALKDCVRRLTDFSLATASDEDTEEQQHEEITNGGDYGNKMEAESKMSMVGMKRAMDFQPYSCHT